MLLSKVMIKNYRLLIDAELEVDERTTLIVGRNNTAKTSCVDLIGRVLRGEKLSYDDYPLSKRNELYELLAKFMETQISYEEFCEKVPITSVEFCVDYSLDDPEANLGALSPFIIDVDVETTTALIRVDYKIKVDKDALWALFYSCFYTADGTFSPKIEDAREIFNDNFAKLFDPTIYAINPSLATDVQIKSQKELSELFPFYSIPAERVLGEDGNQNNSSLVDLIAGFFDVAEEDLDPKIAEQIIELRKIVSEANKAVQRQSDELLSTVVNNAIGFGYPNGEELQLGVTTQLRIDDQIKNQTKLAYTADIPGESLPSSYNGLGYKNLIKMEFMLAAYAKEIEHSGTACIPLLFIEEPESHMHPQMQQAFADYLETFLSRVSNMRIQTFLTSHSAHIANTVDFSKIRYAQKTGTGVIYKNLHSFAKENVDNTAFIRKYLTLTRCDMFFADKVIFVEGASERLLLPDMIAKCDKSKLFDAQKRKLPAQYYALIEIGGAYAYRFIPFVNFLGIPCLILTDIDSMKDGRTKAVVSEGKTTSNSTLKWLMRKIKNIPDNDKTQISLSDIRALSAEEKTIEKCHIEFQTEEQGLCGRSLEEAIINVNRTHYNVDTPVTEETLTFNEKSKTDFALKLIDQYPDYEIPKYIQDGLVWLNEQRVLE